MPITAEYDREADALYVRLNEGPRARTVEIDESTYVDLDASDQAVGLEFLYPAMGVNLVAATRGFGLHDVAASIAAAIQRSGAPVTPGYTGGSSLASMTITMVAVEGTIAAQHFGASSGLTQADPFIRVTA